MRTPGPWWAEGPAGNMGEAEFIAAESKGIAWTCNSWDDDLGQEVTTEEDKANASFIVLACNAHDALTAENARLREALELTVFAVNEGMAGENTDAGPTYQGMRRALQNIRAALAGDCRNSCSLPSDHSGDCNAHHACPKGPGGHGGRHNMTWRKRKAGTGFYCDYCGLSESVAFAGGEK